MLPPPSQCPNRIKDQEDQDEFSLDGHKRSLAAQQHTRKALVNGKKRELFDLARKLATGISARHSFKFEERSQLFIRSHNETLSVVAVCVVGSRPSCSLLLLRLQL
jgi:hypothetical protein